jgi:hypothetical protein
MVVGRPTRYEPSLSGCGAVTGLIDAASDRSGPRFRDCGCRESPARALATGGRLALASHGPRRCLLQAYRRV